MAQEEDYGFGYQQQTDFVKTPDNSFQADFADYGSGEWNPGGPSGDIWMVLNVESSKDDVLTVNDVLYP